MSKQKAILFDVTQCVGCGECYQACKTSRNANYKPNDKFLEDHLSEDTYTVIEKYNVKNEEIYTRKLCMHCQEPTCVSVCPVGAFEKTSLGPVIYDGDKCLGCRYCMQACPHKVPRYEWNKVNPVVKKCTMCYDRIKDGSSMTACAEACQNNGTGATMFGDRDELLKEAKKRIAENPGLYFEDRIYGDSTEAGGTNVLILSPVPFDQLGFAGSLPKEPLGNLTKRALDKIPAVVGVGGTFLTGMYWLTKRKNQIAKEKSETKTGEK